jgi:hypothetical protein
MRRLPRDNETVLRELGDQRVHHVDQVAAVGDEGTLPFA